MKEPDPPRRFDSFDFPINVKSITPVITTASVTPYLKPPPGAPPLRQEYVQDYVRVNQRWWIEVTFKADWDIAIAQHTLRASSIRFAEFQKRYFLEMPTLDNQPLVKMSNSAY